MNLARGHDKAMFPLAEWIHAACVSELEPFVGTALTPDTHRRQFVNAVALGLTNARLEGMTPPCHYSATAPEDSAPSTRSLGD